jgi:hypothetical protein
MTSAEKWNEYQTEYISFGLDMRPPVAKAQEPGIKPVALAPRQRLHAFMLLIACGFVFIGLIGLNAFSSKLQYDINELNKEILARERVVQNLEVDIKTATNIATVEAKALSLGMVYPTFEEIVYLESGGEVQEDFALALIESAYQ